MQAASRMADGQWPWRDFGWAYGPGEPLFVLAASELFGPSLLWWRMLRVAADATAAVLIWALVRDAGPRWALARVGRRGRHRCPAGQRQPDRPGARARARRGPARVARRTRRGRAPPRPPRRSGARTSASSPRSPRRRRWRSRRGGARGARRPLRAAHVASGPGGAGARRPGAPPRPRARRRVPARRGARGRGALRAVRDRRRARHGVGRARRAGRARRRVVAAAVPARFDGGDVKDFATWLAPYAALVTLVLAAFRFRRVAGLLVLGARRGGVLPLARRPRARAGAAGRHGRARGADPAEARSARRCSRC